MDIVIDELFWIRWYAPYDFKRKDRSGYVSFVAPANDVLRETKRNPKMDIVWLGDGSVLRKDYKKPIPRWLLDPLLRAAKIASQDVPVVESTEDYSI